MESSFLVKDVSGFDVVTTQGEVLGQLIDVWPTGSNDIFVVQLGKKEILIPALKTIVLNIDKSQHRITVELPQGLREATSS